MRTCLIHGCNEVHRAIGLCVKHYWRLDKFGTTDLIKRPMVRKRMTPKERVMKHIRVDDETGCWLWTGFKARKGYGGLQLRGPVGAPRQSRIVLAHRLSYEAFNGPIRAGMLVCHSCDTPHCVNPKHLWLGTHQDNCDDKMRKGRHQSQRKAVSRTGVTGVIKRGDKYIAQIKVKGRCNQLGQFSTLADAAECRRRGEISVYGGFSPAMRGSAP